MLGFLSMRGLKGLRDPCSMRGFEPAAHRCNWRTRWDLQQGRDKRNNSGVRGIVNHHHHKKDLRDLHSMRGLKGPRDPHSLRGSKDLGHPHSARGLKSHRDPCSVRGSNDGMPTTITFLHKTFFKSHWVSKEEGAPSLPKRASAFA